MKTRTVAAGILAALGLLTLAPPNGLGASVTFEFRPAPGVAPDYDSASVWLLAEDACAYWEKAAKWSTTDNSFRHTFENLRAGTYYYLVFTGPFAKRKLARPGAFATTVHALELREASSREVISISYEPITNLAFHSGTGCRTGRVVDLDGKPVVGRVLHLGLAVPGRGRDGLYAFDTAITGPDGGFTFRNVNPEASAAVLGEDFDFLARFPADHPLIITNKNLVGRRAPDIAFTDLGDGRERRMSEFRGQPVVLEYWASTCGPCLAPAERFQTFYKTNPEWRGRVELIALSMDHNEATARRHIAKRGWHATRQGWSGAGAWDAPAAKAMHVGSIPCIVVIDASGTIAAHGDARSVNVEAEVNRLLIDKL